MLQRFVSATRGVVTTRALATITARPALVSSSRSVARCFSVDAAVEAVAPAPVAAPAAPPAAAVSTRINRSRRFGTLLARASQTPAVDDLTWPTHEIGERGTLEWRMQFARTRRSSPVPVPYSPWHSIPLLVAPGEQFLRYVNEIPKGTRPKMEIATKEEYNPIKQDVKKGALRNFTYGDLPFNYGALPQTWENPHKAHVLTGKPGDNDPIDVVEVSDTPLDMGAVRVVRVLGAMALLDEGETDFKILAIDMAHPLANTITDPETLEQHMPGKIAQIREWFKMYKTTDGKPENEFAFDGEVQSASMARAIISDTHHEWAALMRGSITDSGGLSFRPNMDLSSQSMVLQSPKLLLADVSFVATAEHRELLRQIIEMCIRSRTRDPKLYERLRDAYEATSQLAQQGPAAAFEMEPTLRALRKALNIWMSVADLASKGIPKTMPGAPVKKSINGEEITTRTPKAVVTDQQSRLVNAMLDPRARDFMLLFNLMSREQTRTQVVYTQLAAIYKILAKRVEQEEKGTATATSDATADEDADAPEASTDAAAESTPAAAAPTSAARFSRRRSSIPDLRVICGALRTYFVDRNVVTREPVPPLMPIIARNQSTPAPEPEVMVATPVKTVSRKAPKGRPRRTSRPTVAAPATSASASAPAGTNNSNTIAKSATRERKPREERQPRKPREPRNNNSNRSATSESAAQSEKPATPAPAATPEESVGDLLAKVMQKLNSSN